MTRSLMAVLSVAFTGFAALGEHASAQVLSVSGVALTSTEVPPEARVFTVDVNLTGFAGAVGAQATLGYDPTLLEFVELTAGDEFTTLIYLSHDDVAAKVIFASGVDLGAPATGYTDASIARATFRTIGPGCAATDAIFFTTSILPTRVTAANGTQLPFTTDAAVTVTSLGTFSLAGMPDAPTVSADAGTTAGALVLLASPTATDTCGTDLAVTAMRSDAAPLSAPYPVGTTTVQFTATDAAGNSATAPVVVTVLDQQLLDAAITLVGVGAGTDSTRPVRISAGGSANVVTVSCIAGEGTAEGVAVPVAAGYPCMTAKDTGHSLTATGSASVVGSRYAATFALDQGDSNDDDLVDILDFSIFVDDFGLSTAGAPSNFNDDAVVNNADFSFIAVNYLATGGSCGAFTGGSPRTAITVRELRRHGLGHLACADLDGNGVVDAADIARFLASGPDRAKPVASAETTSSH